MADKKMYIPNDDAQKFSIWTLNLIPTNQKIQQKPPKLLSQRKIKYETLGASVIKSLLFVCLFSP